MLSDQMQKALNTQINQELYSAYLYLSMAAYFESTNLRGFANWMSVQAREEVAHAEKIFHFISERGGRVLLQPIAGPESDWDSARDVFEQVLDHEQKVTGLIHGLVKLARTGDDYATENFLQWFVSEQVEEEASAGAVLEQLKLIGDQGGGIFMLDRELGTRVFTPPATT